VKPDRARTRVQLAALAICLVVGAGAVGAAAPAGANEPEDAAIAVASNTPGDTVGTLNAKLLEAMKGAEELGYQGRFDLLRPTLLGTFDLDFMASKSIGRGWKTLDDEQKLLWQSAFGRLITANFAGRFEGYSGQSFEILGEEEAAHGTMMVLTKIVDPGKDDVQLNYRMQETEGRWRIVDVYFNGTVSELAMRRSEYSSMFKREGFDELLEAVDARIAKFASGDVD
jgi:phospholipid transport system substrate-binding protein